MIVGGRALFSGEMLCLLQTPPPGGPPPPPPPRGASAASRFSGGHTDPCHLQKQSWRVHRGVAHTRAGFFVCVWPCAFGRPPL